jgi:hypothetical protein
MSERKHTPISLEKKKEIIDVAAKNNNQTKLSEQFKIPRRTISDILGNKASIQKAIEEGGNAKRAWLKLGTYPAMEEALVRWIKQVRSSNLPVSGDVVKLGLLSSSFFFLSFTSDL